jgi:hypothetical protein
MKLTVKQKQDLIDQKPAAGMVWQDEKVLYMDNHGCNVTLVVVQKEGSGELFGFTYLVSSEDAIYDEDMALVPVSCRQVMAFEYQRKDGGEW